MDNIMNRLDKLASLAVEEPAPARLDIARVMRSVENTVPEPAVDIEAEEYPFSVFAAVGAAAAVAAIVVAIFAVSAWSDINNPILAMESLMDVMDVLS